MSRKYYVISMDSAWSPYRPCIGCPNNASDDDGHICHGGTDCPLLTAKEATQVAKGKVINPDMVEESATIGGEDMSFAFPDGATVTAYYTRESK